MGVKDLWNILSPLCEKKPLYELQGKTIAIDLSGWVVDSQTIVDSAVQPKMYLRNLYFRTASLLMQGIFPVFVLEGEAPVLKHKTIARRNDVRNGFQERKIVKKGSRTQFKRVLNQCKEMLKYMGIACVQGHGEAEAMCAYLNEDGLVDGCISQDSDCFLYGAKVVYRNFCTSTQANNAATGGSVDIYTMKKIENILNIGRNKMIALALLCGCDYDEGVNGVGKEAALRFFKTVDDEHVLQRILEWRTDTSLDSIESNLLRTDICKLCGHKGKLQKHTKSGCADCGTSQKCNHDFREKRTLMLNEISLRKKALYNENFPNQELIEEFLMRKNVVPTKLDIEWKQPQVNQFIEFMNKHLCWEPQYAFDKIFILTTRWQLLHLPDLTLNKRLTISDLFIPDEIKKIRNIRSVASYEIVWKKEHNILEILKDYKEQIKENDANDASDNLLTSIEPQNLVLKCYPELVEIFENARNIKTKKRNVNSRKKNASKNIETITEVENITKTRSKKIIKSTVGNKNRKIDEFITVNHHIPLEESFENLTITPKRLKKDNVRHKENTLGITNTSQSVAMNVNRIKLGPQFDRILEVEKNRSNLNNTIDKIFNELSPDDFMSENEENDLNITDIIESVCSTRTFQFDVTNYQTVESNYNDSTNEHMENIVEKCAKIDHCSRSQETHINIENKNESFHDFNDEFAYINESYIPINQRIQSKNK